MWSGNGHVVRTVLPKALLLLISSWQARIVERTSPLPSPECFPTSNVIYCSAKWEKA